MSKIENQFADGLCEDPYQIGCKDEAMYKKIGENREEPDEAVYLCDDCYHAMLDDGNINEDDWELI